MYQTKYFVNKVGIFIIQTCSYILLVLMSTRHLTHIFLRTIVKDLQALNSNTYFVSSEEGVHKTGCWAQITHESTICAPITHVQEGLSRDLIPIKRNKVCIWTHTISQHTLSFKRFNLGWEKLIFLIPPISAV